MTNEFDGAALLIVDDDKTFRSRVASAFRARGFEVREAQSVDDAVREAESFDPELALVDLRMPGGSGLDLVPRLRELCAGIRIVILTGYGSIATAVEALRRGAMNYVTKPATVDAILHAFSERAEGSVIDSALAQTPTLEQVEWEHINRVLLDCGGNVSHAAKALGLHRRSLQRKLAPQEKKKGE